MFELGLECNIYIIEEMRQNAGMKGGWRREEGRMEKRRDETRRVGRGGERFGWIGDWMIFCLFFNPGSLSVNDGCLHLTISTPSPS